MDDVLFSTGGSTEWETPEDFFLIINQVFKFDIDVCATKENTKSKGTFYPKLTVWPRIGPALSGARLKNGSRKPTRAISKGRLS